MFRSGFVNIVGKPNAGKSTLLNALLGEQLSIITYKPQTTRHRIQGILTTADYQIVFSDTPGFIDDPGYKLHEKMNHYVKGTFEDADIMLFLTSPQEEYPDDHLLINRLRKLSIPVFLLMNKTDLFKPAEVDAAIKKWQKRFTFSDCVRISALHNENIDELLKMVIDCLPEGPQYYPEENLSNRNMRFFVAEMIREQIFLQFKEEIPYSTEVSIEAYKEEEKLTRIEALIYVNRKSQKGILIGQKGSSIKALGIAARKRIEAFLGQQVHLALYVKVRENWRNDDRYLDHLGYRK
ncbi:MAG: GTPase Era [Saprospiraceae bacterium]|nr:GTPase Era [Saprospiraceae bacterium]